MKDKIQKLFKFTCCALGVFIFSACQKNLTQIGSVKPLPVSDSIKTEVLPEVAGNFLNIDSLRFFANKQIPKLSVEDAFFKDKIQQKVNQFYLANGFKTKWLTDKSPGLLFYALDHIIKNSERYGLMPNDYIVADIDEKLQTIYNVHPTSAADIVDLDVRISEMFFLFTAHLSNGKIRKAGNSKGVWIRDEKKSNETDIAFLLEAKTSNELVQAIEKLQPTNDQYAKLQIALAQYRSLEKSNTIAFPNIVAKEKIKPNDRHVSIPVIRRKLFLTDLKPYPLHVDTATGLMDSLLYDQELVSAVKWFQVRHGLEPDGILGEKTIKFLNQSIKEKADLIALNMERARWLPENFGDNYIMVNVPEFKLRLYESQKQTLEMKVIVGAVDKPTPIFNDALEHIVFSPTWTVPISILKEEIIPRLRRDSLYYAQKNYSFYKNEVLIDPGSESWRSESVNPYQYRVVQQPGPDNSLGLVKFIMPNNMNVYLHDTPNHSLFSKNFRALSHGCIRLDEPAKFAEYLLKGQKGWDKEAIDKAMHTNISSTILLKKRCKVFIEYRTVWVDDNGLVNFREDIYGHDKNHLQEFFTVEKSSTPLAGI